MDIVNFLSDSINADDVITFCIYLVNKMRKNVIKIRSCAIFSWFNRFYRFELIFRSLNVLVFDWLIRKYETFSLVQTCL